MSNVVEMPPLVFSEGNPIPPRRNLIWLSRTLAILFTLFVAAAGLWILAAGIMSFVFADHVRVGTGGAFIYLGKPPHQLPGTVLYASQPVVTRLAGMADIVIATAPIILVFWELRRLFRLYARGIVFARENTRCLRRAGLWLLLYPFAKFAANMIFRVAGGTDKAWFHMDLIYALVLGLIVLAIAQVMEFGREIEQEKDSFV
jgi:hypothetical protein